ncbi:hypothetical protein D1007_37792 [Hordeum vulgare]|nr:hypothetical protein D1007_37792 [Hordeum vulgare]
MLRRMETASSSSSGSRSRSSGSAVLLPVKSELRGTPLRRCMPSGALVINEASSSHLIKRKTEPALLPVKKEHEAIAADKEIVLKWVRDDYVREKMERRCCALEEISA